jgi:hypothetical protein
MPLDVPAVPEVPEVPEVPAVLIEVAPELPAVTAFSPPAVSVLHAASAVANRYAQLPRKEYMVFTSCHRR